MRPCGDIVGKMCCATSGFAGSPSNLQRRESLTGEAIGDPTEDTGTGTKGTATGRTQRDITMGEVQDAVLEEAVTLVGEDMSGITS